MTVPTAPAITVLLPVHNAGRYLRTAVESVLQQSFRDFELLVIDDGSTDAGPEIISAIDDPRLRVVTHTANLGLVATLNEGVELARGRYIARMDADDEMHPDRLWKQFERMETHPELAVLSTFVELMNSDGETTGVWDTDRMAADEHSIRALMPSANCIAHPAVMIRITALKGLRYHSERAGAEDWDLWLRMLARGHRISKLPEALLRYRVHAGSIMGGSKAVMSAERRSLRARSRYLRSEWWRPGIWSFNGRVLVAQFRTLARIIRLHGVRVARDAFRSLTYSPIGLLREHRSLSKALSGWGGDHLYLFPYLNRGGAEQVHLDVLACEEEHRPLVMITGFSTDRGNAARFAARADVVELPRLLNHPFTRGPAQRRIAAHLNSKPRPLLFSSLTTTFYDLLPLLVPRVRAVWLQHAFLFQPDGNVQHRAWLRHFHRVNAFAFISREALNEFSSFLFAHNIPRSAFSKLHYLPNAVHHFGSVRPHGSIGVLFVGRNSPEKRLHIFLAMAARMQAQWPGVFRFTVVGNVEDRVSGDATFLGAVDVPVAMERIYADHDILALTSSREGFPMVVMEAMAQGMAIMSTPVGDVPNRLNSECAYITPKVDEGECLEAMCAWLQAIAQDPDRLERMRRSALALAMKEYRMEDFRRRYQALLSNPAAST